MYCPACGTQCPDNASYCPQCGFRLPRVAVPTASEVAPSSPSSKAAPTSGFKAPLGGSRQYRIQQKPKSGMTWDYDIYDDSGSLLLKVVQNNVTALQAAVHIATFGEARSQQKRSYICRDNTGQTRFSFEMRPSGKITVTRPDSSLIATVRPLSGLFRSYEVLGPSDQSLAIVKARLADDEDHWFRITGAQDVLLGYLDHFSGGGLVSGFVNGAKDMLTLGLAKDVDKPYCVLTPEVDINDDLLSALFAVAVHYDHSWE